MTTRLPPSASVALPTEDAKLHAPAADRNRAALVELLGSHAPRHGQALEIASGTGQHISAFATAFPDLHWQPTEPDAARRASIDAYTVQSLAKNVAPAIALDATQAGWHAQFAPQNVIFLSNLLHLIPADAAQRLIAEAALATAPGGCFILYGPFRRAGLLTSEGDARFDRELREADPKIGYKDTTDVTIWLSNAGFSPIDQVEMPANNLAFVARKP
jgi:SAM-dependent methyltransferase